MTGNNTSHQLHAITPHNFKTTNTTVIIMAIGVRLIFIVFDLIILYSFVLII